MLILSQILIKNISSSMNPNKIFNNAFEKLFGTKKLVIFQPTEKITVSLLFFLKEGDLYFIIGTNSGKV